MYKLVDAQSISLRYDTFDFADMEPILLDIEKDNPFGLGYATYIQTNLSQVDLLFVVVDGGEVSYTINHTEFDEEMMCSLPKESPEELTVDSGKDI